MTNIWTKGTLEDICFYVSQKIKTCDLTKENYLSTENMLPEKQGIVDATCLPTLAYSHAFLQNDILISNIRPYFKKIWFARFNGGCSNDVLVFRAKDGIDPRFLYYVLSNNKFFDYATTTAKGTKMPRGDRTAILQYPITFPSDIDIQKKIAGVLSALDDKIELNNQINSNLEQQAQALFKSWFIDFEPFGGKMPNDWEPANVEKAIVLHDSQRIPLSSNQRMSMEKRYPYYGATSIMDFVDNYIFDGKFLLLAEDGTVIDKNDRPVLQYVYGKFWANNHAHVISGKNGFSVEFLYLFFKQTNIKGFVTGAVQPKINQANLKSIPINIPTKNILSEFDVIIQPLFNLFIKNNNENQRLSEIRDSLLPKLMSGEIDVSKVDIEQIINNKD